MEESGAAPRVVRVDLATELRKTGIEDVAGFGMDEPPVRAAVWIGSHARHEARSTTEKVVGSFRRDVAVAATSILPVIFGGSVVPVKKVEAQGALNATNPGAFSSARGALAAASLRPSAHSASIDPGE
jgi:hypothetical protein